MPSQTSNDARPIQQRVSQPVRGYKIEAADQNYQSTNAEDCAREELDRECSGHLKPLVFWYIIRLLWHVVVKPWPHKPQASRQGYATDNEIEQAGDHGREEKRIDPPILRRCRMCFDPGEEKV